MPLKNLFDKKSGLLASSSLNDIGSTIESEDFLEEYKTYKNRVIPPIDFTTGSNWCKFGSLEGYYSSSLSRVYDNYPYDGSLFELYKWHNESTDYELYLLENEYPRTTGYINFSANGWGTQASENGGYGLPSTTEYIFLKGGPNVGPAGTRVGANIYDTTKNRESNLKYDLDEGVTVEFWLKKPSFDTSKTTREVIFDLWNGLATTSMGRLRIELSGSPTGSPFYLTALSGNVGFYKSNIGTGLTTSSIEDWNHYAFAFQNSGSTIKTRMYVNGALNVTMNSGSAAMSEVIGNQSAYIGALRTPTSASAGVQYSGKLSASLDEFRYWKTARNSEQISKNWFRQVYGGSNTIDNNAYLGVYYKFNEGITTATATDSVVLDYSGRLTNGAWTGYTSNSRNTGSAMVSASAAPFEFEDPIVYSNHPTVASLITSKQLSGSMFDTENHNMLINYFPSWILDEDGDEGDLYKLCQIVSSYLDKLHVLTEYLPKLKTLDYYKSEDKPFFYNNKLLKEFGLNAPDLFVDSNVFEYLDKYDSYRPFQTSLNDIKNTIYKNIYNNLVGIYKAKGTEKSIRNLLRCFGTDDQVIDLKVYSNNDVYEFVDNTKQTLAKKSYINLNNPLNFEGVVYQTFYESGSAAFFNSPDNYFDSMTFECEAVFPKPFEVDNESYFQVPFLTSSVYGCNSIKAGLGTASLETTVQTTAQNRANFQVYAIRPSIGSKDCYFVLTGSENSPFAIGTVLPLTSSLFENVYDDSKWNFAVRIYNTQRPYAGLVSGTHDGATLTSDKYNWTFDFYGVNYDLDIKRNSFHVSSSYTHSAANNTKATSFVKDPKRIYGGAFKTNVTGSVVKKTDVKLSSLRMWHDYLENDVIDAHAKDVFNYGRKHPYRNSQFVHTYNSLQPHQIPEIETLVLNWDFSKTVDIDTTNFYVLDFSSGSTTTRYGVYAPIKYRYPGRSHGIGTTDYYVTDMVQNLEFQLPEYSYSSDDIDILTTTEQNVLEKTQKPRNKYYTIEKNIYDSVSKEMVNMFGGIVDFNNLVGEPVNKYRESYKLMDKLRNIFYEKVDNTPDIEKYIEYFKWMDSSMTNIISQLFPVSSQLDSDVKTVIESHILERNKIVHKFPFVQKDYGDVTASFKSINELKYDWKHGHAPISNLQSDNCSWWNKRYLDNAGWLASASVKEFTRELQNSVDIDCFEESYEQGVNLEYESDQDRLLKLRSETEAFPMYTENFANGGLPTGWSSSPVGWTTTNVATPTANTGPDNAQDGAGGAYAFFEATGKGNANYQLNFPATGWSESNKRVQFYYYAYGANIGGAFCRYKNSVGSWITITAVNWDGVVASSISGEKHAAGNLPWKLAFFDIPSTVPNPVELQIVYQHNSGVNDLADFAVDTITYPTSISNAKAYIKDSEVLDIPKCNDNLEIEEKHIRDAKLRYGGNKEIDSKKFLPHVYISSSVSQSYDYPLFSSGDRYTFTHVHRDKHKQGMQSPFTDQHVGGYFYRKWKLNKDATDTISNRQEAWRSEKHSNGLIFFDPSIDSEGSIVDRQNLIWTKEETVSRCYNTKHIQSSTGSSILGNYSKPYEIFVDCGRRYNDLWWKDNIELIPTASEVFTLRVAGGYKNYTLPSRGTDKNIIVQKFSAPGEIATLSRGYLDPEHEEVSPYNALPFRNTSVLFHSGANDTNTITNRVIPYNNIHGARVSYYSWPTSTQNFAAGGLPSGWTSTVGSWNTIVGATPSADTGPNNAQDGAGGGYAFFESTARANSTFYLYPPVIDWDLNNKTLQFYYYAYGADIGTFYLQYKDTLGAWKTGTATWDGVVGTTNSGQKQADGDQPWKLCTVDFTTIQGAFTAPDNPVELRIVYSNVNGETDVADFAIDTFSYPLKTLAYKRTSDGLRPLLTRHRGKFGIDSQLGTLSAVDYDTHAAYHEVHRNGFNIIKLANANADYAGISGPSNFVTSTQYDNWWLERPIPASDLSYMWITSSYTLSRVYGAAPPKFILSTSAGLVPAIEFVTSSNPNLSASFVNTHFAVAQDIVTSSYLLSASNGTYVGPYGSTLTSGEVLNLLNLTRNGPYQYPSWKQIRQDDNLVVRWMKKNNIMPVVDNPKATVSTINGVRLPVMPTRGSKITQYIEPPITNKYYPLKVTVKNENSVPMTVEVPLGGQMNMFANDALTEQVGAFKNIEDSMYRRLYNLYRPDNCGDKKYELVNLKYKESVFPKENREGTKSSRVRENFVNNFWRQKHGTDTDSGLGITIDSGEAGVRVQADHVNSQGETIPIESIWPLDGRVSYESGSDMFNFDGTITQGTLGQGELMNDYCLFHHGTKSNLKYGALYVRKHPFTEAALNKVAYVPDAYWTVPMDTGKKPFHKNYDEYWSDLGQNKQHALISEFKISDHMPYYVVTKKGDFLAENTSSFSLTGSEMESTSNSSFFTEYSHSDFLKYFEVIENDHKSQKEKSSFKLSCKGDLKLLPYNGFYPVSRTLELATLFSQSYAPNIKSFGADSEYAWRPFLQPFFMPGILYNTIKSCLAVDYPIITGTIGAADVDDPLETYLYASNPDHTLLSSGLNYRVPFETILDPSRLNGIAICDQEPHPSASLDCEVLLRTGNESGLYTLGMHNFLAEAADMFLENNSLTTFVSNHFVNKDVLSEAKNQYIMDVFISKDKTGKFIEGIYSDFDRPHSTHYAKVGGDVGESSFGPSCLINTDGSAYKTFAPFTPPYSDGCSYARIKFNPNYSTNYETVEDIVSELTASYYRWDDALLSPFTTAISEVGFDQQMTISSSCNLFQLTEVKNINYEALTGKPFEVLGTNENAKIWAIQPKFETPSLFLSESATVLPTVVSGEVGAYAGIWHQYCLPPTEDKGIFLGIRNSISLLEAVGGTVFSEQHYDKSTTGSLADLVGFQKTAKKIGQVAQEKVIGECVVAIPFINVNQEKQFFNIDRTLIDKAELIVQGDVNDGTVGKSIVHMVEMMNKYVFPPRFDFVKHKGIDPFAMYVFEFTHTLSQQDLVDIWQNVMPEIGTRKVEKSVEIGHELLPNELLGSELPTDLRWMVFKVKMKAKTNYYKLTADSKDDKKFKFDFDYGEGAKQTDEPAYSYNWPYDYFSLVELMNLNAEITYGDELDKKQAKEEIEKAGTPITGQSQNFTVGASAKPALNPDDVAQGTESGVQQLVGQGAAPQTGFPLGFDVEVSAAPQPETAAAPQTGFPSGFAVEVTAQPTEEEIAEARARAAQAAGAARPKPSKKSREQKEQEQAQSILDILGGSNK